MLTAITFRKILPSATAPIAQTAWSAAFKAADISLSSGNTVATSSSAPATGGTVLSASSKNTGKFYAEMRNTFLGGYGSAIGAGIDLVASNLATYLGGDINGMAAWVDGTGGTQRHTYKNAVTANAQTPGVWGLNTNCRIAVDVGAGKLWLSHWSATAWLGGGDPASGTSPTYTFTGGSTTWLAACPRASSNAIALVDPGSWLSAAPTGFGVWT
jgi:hypothetical protein